MDPWELRVFCEKRAINKWNSTFIFPEYVVQYVGNSEWKKLNAYLWKENHHFGRCRLIGKEKNILVAKKYQVIESYVSSVDYRESELIIHLNELYNDSLTMNCRKTFRENLEEIVEYFYPKVSIELQNMLYNIEAYATVYNFDFRIDNVLYDPDINHYIFWDIINE